MSKRAAVKIEQLTHYFLESNPYRSIDSIAKLLDTSLSKIPSQSSLIALNKPPGLVLSNKQNDKLNLIPVVKETLKKRLDWPNCLFIPIASDFQSGLFLCASDHETFKETLKLMKEVYPTTHYKSLSYYAITTHIPIKPKGQEVLFFQPQLIDNHLVYINADSVSNNKIKRNQVFRMEIEHEVVDSNPDLDVALVKFKSGYHNNDNCDGVLAYSIQNLAPVLGDHRYSCRVRTVLGKPTLSPLLKPEPQILREQVMKRLGINRFMAELIPLHLHSHQVTMQKSYKKQTLVFEQTAPLLPYFKQTLSNLGLKIPNE